MIRRGPRPRATPTSCCRRRSRWSARISAPRPAIRCWWRCTARSRPSARRATTTRSSPGWRERLGHRRGVYRGPLGAAVARTHLRADPSRAAAERGVDAPDFDAVLGSGRAGAADRCRGMAASLRDFRRDPDAAPLPTPSGRIEIASATIAGFGYPDCPGHPDLAAAGRRRRLARRGALPAPADRQPAGDAAAQPAGFRRHQPGVEDQRARAGAHPSAGCRGARHWRRRHRAALQRSRRLPRRRGAERCAAPGRGAAGDRRLVRPG